MKTTFLLFLSLFLFTSNLKAQVVKLDEEINSICIEKDFSYMLPMAAGKFLVSRDKENYIVNEEGKALIDLRKYSNPVFHPFSSNLSTVRDKESSKFGYIGLDGTLKIPLQYDKAFNFSDHKAIVNKSGKYGMIDTLNQVVLPFEYEDLNPPHGNKIPAKKEGKFGLINFDQENLLAFKYKKLCFFLGDLLKAEDQDGVFLIDSTGREVSMKQRYQQIAAFYNDTLRFELDGKWGLMDISGKKLSDKTFDYIGPLRKALSVAKIERKRGVIDKNGKEVLPFVYDFIEIKSSFIKARQDGQYSFYDFEGNQIFKKYSDLSEIGPCGLFFKAKINNTFKLLYNNQEEVFRNRNFERIKAISDNFLLAKQDGQWYYFPLDSSPPFGPFENVKPFYKGLAIVKKDGKQSVINSNGKILSTYDEIQNLSGVYKIRQGDKWGVTADITTEQADLVYDKLQYFSKQYFIPTIGDKQGLMTFDPLGVVIPIKYQKVKVPYNTACKHIIIQKGDRQYGLADKSGKKVLAPRFRYIDFANDCRLKIETTSGEGIVNENLDLVVDTIYEYIQPRPKAKLYAVKKNRLWGFIDLEGHTVIDHKYKKYRSFRGQKGYAAVLDEKEWYLINKNGQRISDQSYSDLLDVWGRIDELYKVQQNKKWGVIDTNGNPFLPLIFDKLKRSKKDWIVTIEGLSFTINSSMECIQDCPDADFLEKYNVQIKNE